MATNDIRWKEHIGDVTENICSRTRSRGKKRGRWSGGRVLLLLGPLFVLITVTIGCRAPVIARRALRTATPVLLTPNPVVPTATPVLPTPVSPTQASVVPTATPLPSPTQVGEKELAPSAPSFGFAVLNAVPEEGATAGNVEEIRAQFRKLRYLGVNVVVQSFPSESNETDWIAYLDAAMQEDLQVAGWFESQPPVWTGNSFDLGINEVFLRAVKDHPALYAIFLVDEPFHKKHGWEITAERLQLLYQQAKAIAPNVPVAVQFSREIQKAEEGRNPQYVFKSGMCDICNISSLEFRNYGEGNRFYSDVLIKNHLVSRAVVKREAPGAEIWTTVQVFGSATGGSTYYMSSADEVQQMVDLLLSPELQAAGELDGIIWQSWASFHESQEAMQYTLGDPECEAQRNTVRETAIRLGLLSAP